MRIPFTKLLTLPLLLSGAAYAQVVRLDLPIQPVRGLPPLVSSLPGAATPLAGAILRLPTAKPALLPDLTLAPAAPAGMIVMASAAADLPKVRIDADRENAKHPLRRIFPVLRLEPTAEGKRGAEQDKDRSDDLFDRGEPREPAPRAPLGSGRRIGLPEDDLESELGL